MDWYGTLRSDGVLLNIGFRESDDPNDVRLSQPPPTVRPGVLFRFNSASNTAVPFIPYDDSDARYEGAVALRLSSGWGSLSADIQSKIQLIIDGRAIQELNMDAPDALMADQAAKLAAADALAASAINLGALDDDLDIGLIIPLDLPVDPNNIPTVG